MLTKEQLENAVSEVQDCTFHRPSVGAVRTVEALAAAHERVTALLDPSHAWDDEDNEKRTITVAELRRALEG